jgi:hypothetical protein
MHVCVPLSLSLSLPLCVCVCAQYGRGAYRDKVQDMIRRKDTRLVVSLDDLRRFDAVLAERDPAHQSETRKYAPLLLHAYTTPLHARA